MRELWALLHFLEPEQFPDCDAFVEQYSTNDANKVRGKENAGSVDACMDGWAGRRVQGLQLGLQRFMTALSYSCFGSCLFLLLTPPSVSFPQLQALNPSRHPYIAYEATAYAASRLPATSCPPPAPLPNTPP